MLVVCEHIFGICLVVQQTLQFFGYLVGRKVVGYQLAYCLTSAQDVYQREIPNLEQYPI